MKKTHLRLWSGFGDHRFGHPNRSGGIFRLDGSDGYVRSQSRRTKSALRRMASIARSRISMAEAERERRAVAFAAPLTGPERDAAMRALFGRAAAGRRP